MKAVRLRKAEGVGSSQMGVGDGVVLVISVTLILALVRCGCSRIPSGGGMRLLRLKRFLKVGILIW